MRNISSLQVFMLDVDRTFFISHFQTGDFFRILVGYDFLTPFVYLFVLKFSRFLFLFKEVLRPTTGSNISSVRKKQT